MTRQQLLDTLLAQERTTDMVLVFNLAAARKEAKDVGTRSSGDTSGSLADREPVVFH